MRVPGIMLSLAACAALVASAAAQSPVCAEGDIVVALSANVNNYVYYDASAGTWSLPSFGSAGSQPYAIGTGFGPDYSQGCEFDNFGGVFGLPTGNLLTQNFGNSFTGFDVYNMATDGGSQWTSLWSVKHETRGSVTTRGGGLSINPSGTRVAWASYDGYSHTDGDGDLANGSCIFVLDYIRGANPGDGSGFKRNAAEADIRGPRVTGFRTGIGAAGKTSCTQGTTWLSDDVVAMFNGFGDIVTWDVSGVPAGADASPRLTPTTSMSPEVDMGWVVANDEVSVNAQTTTIEYNPGVDPYKIFAAVTTTSFTGILYMFDYDPATGAISLNQSLTLPTNYEPREIGLDGNGDLYWSNYAGSGVDYIVCRLNGAYDPDAWMTSNVQVLYSHGEYSPYNGMDVAANIADTCAGDANRDGMVDQADRDIIDEYWEIGNAWFEGDFNGDGTVGDGDFSILLTNWGAGDTYETGDLNGDGTVDDADFSVMLNNWGDCDVAECNIPRSCE